MTHSLVMQTIIRYHQIYTNHLVNPLFKSFIKILQTIYGSPETILTDFGLGTTALDIVHELQRQ